MSTTTSAQQSIGARTNFEPWQGGVVGGLLGGLTFGFFLSLVAPGVVENAIPALYALGTPAGFVGWAIHMCHGAVLGVVFAVLADADGIDRGLATNLDTAVAGLVYSLLVWAALAVVLMPLWLGAVGFPNAPPLPNISTISVGGHTLYGIVLGISYSVLSN
jgi:hypothetical protein